MSFSDSEYSSQGAEYKTFRQISRDRTHHGQSYIKSDVPFMQNGRYHRPRSFIAYVYFSSPVPKDLLTRIKNDTSVLPRIGALREGFVTDHERALEELFGDNAENSRRFDACLNEFPFVRYRAAKGLDGATAATGRDLVPMKLAQAIAPVIHEWTYDAMCHDLLDLDGNKYVQEIPSKSGGEPQRKEVLLEDHDPVWLELRHTHIAEASERLHDKMTNFVSKNKAAQLQQRDGSELSTRDLQKMVQALPQYNEQMEKLSLHVEIAGKINTIIRESGLRELGQLEQDLVFGEAGTKEVITFLRSKQEGMCENKLRLLMIYACVYPEKFEGDKAIKLMQVAEIFFFLIFLFCWSVWAFEGYAASNMFGHLYLLNRHSINTTNKPQLNFVGIFLILLQLAKLSRADMKTVKNMKLLEGSDSKKASHGTFSLKFDSAKELIENLSKGELPKDEYQCMNNASPSNHGTQGSSGAPQAPPSVRTGSSAAPHSMRSRRTATWARPRASDDGYSSDSVLRSASSDFRKMGQRIFVFIIGGATRSEVKTLIIFSFPTLSGVPDFCA
ncbi:hypothetical protein DH2020_002322 [Rehmannia glutinosa]|uniref:Uncharacterized protein n=1 Tax=Rehmannia glutinosa TaxID=99300 RepID=A0ABR0XTZ8_REHGL